MCKNFVHNPAQNFWNFSLSAKSQKWTDLMTWNLAWVLSLVQAFIVVLVGTFGIFMNFIAQYCTTVVVIEFQYMTLATAALGFQSLALTMQIIEFKFLRNILKTVGFLCQTKKAFIFKLYIYCNGILIPWIHNKINTWKWHTCRVWVSGAQMSGALSAARIFMSAELSAGYFKKWAQRWAPL